MRRACLCIAPRWCSMAAEAFRLGVEQALAVAILRKVERQGELLEAVQQAERAGIFVPYTPAELWTLESAGLHYDLRSGLFREVMT